MRATVGRIERAAARRYPRMLNRAMARALTTGGAVDVRSIGRPLEGVAGVYELDRFIDDVDYCDGATEAWIWSIGVALPLPDGCGFAPRDEYSWCSTPGCAHVIRAATDGRFYQASNYVCVWLR